LTDLHGKFVTINNWALNLRTVDSDNNPFSYLNYEIQLVIKELKPNFSCKMSCSSFLLNIYKDCDVKLDFAIYKHFRIQEAANAAYNNLLPEFDELEESKRPTSHKNKWKLKDELPGTRGLDIADYEELVKKEIPELSKIQEEQVIDYMKNEYSSGYVGSKNKPQNTREMAVEPPLKLQTPDDIKKAIQKIISYQKKAEDVDAFATPAPKMLTKDMLPPTPMSAKSGSKRVAKKQPMTISRFQEYMGWYEKQSNAGKFSYVTNKSSMKKSTPAIGRK
jgi:hypothetical protein